MQAVILALWLFAQTLVPGTVNTWTDGTFTWAGNQYCVGPGYNYTLQPTSPAIDAGAWDGNNCKHISMWQLECVCNNPDGCGDGLPNGSVYQLDTTNCPSPGSALNQPKLPDGSYCLEWYGKAPDIGSCEYYVAAAAPLVCTVGNNTLTGCYYTPDLSGQLQAVQNDGTALSFTLSSTWPPAPIPQQYFAARWEGNFDLAAGLYEFDIFIDDGARLYVDNNLLIDQWIEQAPTSYTAQIQLGAGTHDIKMEYFQAAGGAWAGLSWKIVAPQNVVTIKTNATMLVSRRATDTSTVIALLVNSNTVIGPGGFEISYPPGYTLTVSRRATNTSTIASILVNHSMQVVVNGVPQ